MEQKKGGEKEELKEYEANPFNPNKKKPEDIIRIFYKYDLPIIPVISRRGFLIGILAKEDVVSELSDIDQAQTKKIDQFITKLARKMSLDEVLAYAGSIKEFTLVDTFGDEKGKWTRLELFNACEGAQGKKTIQNDLGKEKEEKIMEWMIYLILEHIPRAIYAQNKEGKTFFFNSYFEDLLEEKLGKLPELEIIEKSFANSGVNEFFRKHRDSKEIYFYNSELKIYYEKIPLLSDKKTMGYLIYCSKDLNDNTGIILTGINPGKKSLDEILELTEKSALLESINAYKGDKKKASGELKITIEDLNTRMKKYGLSDGPKDIGSKK